MKTLLLTWNNSEVRRKTPRSEILFHLLPDFDVFPFGVTLLR